MRFYNLTKGALSFNFDGHQFDVPVDGECEMPDSLAADVKRRGLPLTPASEVEPEAAPPPQAPKGKAPSHFELEDEPIHKAPTGKRK